MQTQRQKTNKIKKAENKVRVYMLAPYESGKEIFEKDTDYEVDGNLAKKLLDLHIAVLSSQKIRYQNKMLKINYERI